MEHLYCVFSIGRQWKKHSRARETKSYTVDIRKVESYGNQNPSEIRTGYSDALNILELGSNFREDFVFFFISYAPLHANNHSIRFNSAFSNLEEWRGKRNDEITESQPTVFVQISYFGWRKVNNESKLTYFRWCLLNSS